MNRQFSVKFQSGAGAERIKAFLGYASKELVNCSRMQFYLSIPHHELNIGITDGGSSALA